MGDTEEHLRLETPRPPLDIDPGAALAPLSAIAAPTSPGNGTASSDASGRLAERPESSLGNAAPRPNSSPGPGATTSVFGVPLALVWILAVGAFFRFVFFPHPSFGTDMVIFRSWGQELASQPISDFYENNPEVDHLPGDLWIHWALAELYQHFSPDFADRAFSYEELLKVPPALADLGIAVIGFVFVRRWADMRAALGAAWFLALNPALWFISTIWGQWDSISAFVALLSVYSLFTRRWFLSFAVLAYAALIKPQLAALAPLFVLFIALQHLIPLLASHGKGMRLAQLLYPNGVPAPRETTDSFIEKLLLAAGAAVVVVGVVCLPFDVGFPPVGSVSLVDRTRAALDLYNATTMGAFNFWNTWVGGTISYEQTRIPDSGTSWFGWTYQQWGMILAVVGYLAAVVIFLVGWRSRRDKMTLWAAAAMTLTLFVFPTRIHERYFVPALVLAIVFAYLVPRFKPIVVILTVAFFFNVVYVFDVYNDFLGRQTYYAFLFDGWFVPTVSSVVVVSYLAFVLLGGHYALAPHHHPTLWRRSRPSAAQATETTDVADSPKRLTPPADPPPSIGTSAH